MTNPLCIVLIDTETATRDELIAALRAGNAWHGASRLGIAALRDYARRVQIARRNYVEEALHEGDWNKATPASFRPGWDTVRIYEDLNLNNSTRWTEQDRNDYLGSGYRNEYEVCDCHMPPKMLEKVRAARAQQEAAELEALESFYLEEAAADAELKAERMEEGRREAAADAADAADDDGPWVAEPELTQNMNPCCYEIGNRRRDMMIGSLDCVACGATILEGYKAA
tara:strand:- start:181 stop:861 length:681 start_codon:yes stop_codon:yes gene_type:complete